MLYGTTAITSVVDTAAAAAALAVATTARMVGSCQTLRVCGVQLGDLHTHTKNHRHSGARWKGLFKAESFSTLNYGQTVESGKKLTNFD
jgi:hypothetical protein